MNTKSVKLISIITVIALFATVVFAAAAFAQSSTTDSLFQRGTEQFAGRGGPGGERGERPPRIEGLREAVEVSIAETLGMSVEELQASHEGDTRLPELAEAQGVDMADVEAAIETTKQAVVNQAVADGTITEEQAEAILSHKGGPRRGGPGGERGERPPRIEGLREAVEASIAETLGITVEELQASHEDGTRLPELAEAQGVDMADVEAAIETTKQAVVNQAVADGTITEEQAEAILSHKGGPRRGGPGGPRNGGTFNQGSFQGPSNGNSNAPAFGDSTL